jgi:hypothetical protein
MAFVTDVAQFIAGVRAVVAGTPRTAASVNAGLTDLASRTKWLKELVGDSLVGAPLTVSAADATADTLTVTAHALPANTAVRIFAANGGVLPGGLTANTVYYVGVTDANTIQFSATSGPGAFVDITAGFAGDVYVAAIPDLMTSLLMSSVTYGSGALGSLVMFLAGTQAITGAKLFSDLTLSSTNTLKYASRSLTRAIQGTWVNLSSNTAYKGLFPSIPAGQTVVLTFELPHGQVLTGVTITINPDDVGSLPTLPTLDIGYITISTGVDTPVGATFTDLSGDFTTYSAIHDIAATALAHTIDAQTRQYYAVFTNLSATAISIIGIRRTVTATSEKTWA